MMRKAGSGLLVWLVILFAAPAAHAQAATTPVPDFAPGQEWSIKSASPLPAKVVVGRVETWQDKTVVHVSILDVPIQAGTPGAGAITEIAHMPFEKSALAASVDRLVATGVSPSPNFEAGYEGWQSAKGGVFTITVPQAIDFASEAMTRVRR